MNDPFSSALNFDSRFLYASTSNTSHLIQPQTVTKLESKVAAAIASVNQQLMQKKYGFIEVLKDEQYLQETRQVFTQLQWAKTLVVVGIGGSDLGARAIQQALEAENPPMEVLFHGDSTDPVQITRLLKKIDLEQTVFNIVSKSGQTVETTTQYLFFKNLYQQKDDWVKHFVFTTDPQDGVLRQEATQYAILTVPIPPTVGGRFSVLTPVGLLPALAMGVDVETMMNSAASFFTDVQAQKMAQDFAASQIQLSEQGIKVCVIMPYAIQLEEFARWFRQLWAESLGKDNQGILPIQARGPADQHSQGQFYNQGTPMQSLLFVRVEQRTDDYTLQNIDLADAQYLEGHTFAEILNAEQRAAALALKKLGRPSVTLSVSELNAATIGQLFAFFELAVVYLAAMLDVNAFDQPGVEEGKQMMYALLGRAGFEVKKKEIEALE